jgi:hypothetical protein
MHSQEYPLKSNTTLLSAEWKGRLKVTNAPPLQLHIEVSSAEISGCKTAVLQQPHLCQYHFIKRFLNPPHDGALFLELETLAWN